MGAGVPFPTITSGLDRLQSRGRHGRALTRQALGMGLRKHSPQSLLGVKSWFAVGPQDTPGCN